MTRLSGKRPGRSIPRDMVDLGGRGLIWLTYALLRQDMAIIVSAFFQALTSGLIVVLKLVRQANIQRQEG